MTCWVVSVHGFYRDKESNSSLSMGNKEWKCIISIEEDLGTDLNTFVFLHIPFMSFTWDFGTCESLTKNFKLRRVLWSKQTCEDKQMSCRLYQSYRHKKFFGTFCESDWSVYDPMVWPYVVCECMGWCCTEHGKTVTGSRTLLM